MKPAPPVTITQRGTNPALIGRYLGTPEGRPWRAAGRRGPCWARRGSGWARRFPREEPSQLVMQAAQRARDGARMVFLHEALRQSGTGIPLRVVTLEEEAAAVLEHAWIYDHDARQSSRRYVHASGVSRG